MAPKAWPVHVICHKCQRKYGSKVIRLSDPMLQPCKDTKTCPAEAIAHELGVKRVRR